MKTTFKALIIAVTILVTNVTASLAQDFHKGMEAYQLGDYAAALSEFRPLVEEGNAEAQLYLGYMYEKGQGVIQDNVYAYMWFNIAALNGDNMGMFERGFVAEKMTPADITKAQDLERECMKKNYKGCVTSITNAEVGQISYAKMSAYTDQCGLTKGIWHSLPVKKDGVEVIHRFEFRGFTGDYNSIRLSEIQDGNIAWTAEGKVTCSNGASICYIMSDVSAYVSDLGLG